MEELSLAASKTMLGLKADQESLPARAALQVRPAPQDTALPWVQERQLSLVVAGLAEELTSGRLELEDELRAVLRAKQHQAHTNQVQR